ncbi:MAG: thioredoxin domain-containing protein [Candidatus Paceibacterota bacterium]
MQLNHTQIATSIVLGFGLVAVAIFFKFSTNSSVITEQKTNVASASASISLSPDEIKRGEYRHLYGSEEADIVIVEFSDFECPFCARLHPTLKRIVDESNGKIAWEYRHLPLPIHENAFLAAVSAECIARELGNDAFWNFTEILFANVGSNNEDFLKNYALSAGLSESTYNSCMSDNNINTLISTDLDVARQLGANGTPFSLIIDGDSVTPVVGALPYEQWRVELGI